MGLQHNITLLSDGYRDLPSACQIYVTAHEKTRLKMQLRVSCSQAARHSVNSVLDKLALRVSGSQAARHSVNSMLDKLALRV